MPMNSFTKPSIFTSRDSFSRPSTDPAGTSTPPRPSHSRRQSTPEALERNRIHAASGATFLTPSSSTFDSAAPPSADRAPQSRWTSLDAANHRRGRASAGAGNPKARSASASHNLPSTTPSEYPPPPSGAAHTAHHPPRKKRPSYDEDARAPTSAPSAKRPKLNLTPRAKHYLDSFSPRAVAFQADLQPPSPLFFSNSPRPRPTLPPRFSSSEAAAKMMSKARTEDSHVKTVSLARGVVTTPNAPTSAPHQQNFPHRAALEGLDTSRSGSPEVSTPTKDASGLLSSVGIVELLEQDERPTFIVDLAARENYGTGPLQLLYTNPSLRYYSTLAALVSGHAPEDASPGPATYLQFKSWLMSATINGESLDVCLPSFVFASMAWSCATLRKRLRIISGAFLATPGGAKSSSLRSSVAPLNLNDTSSQTPEARRPVRVDEPSDYFGAAAPQASDDSSSTMTEPVPSVEDPSFTSAISSESPETSTIDPNGILAPRDVNTPGSQTLQPAPVSIHITTPGSIPPISTSASALHSPLEDPSQGIIVQQPDAPSFDWTRLPISDSMPKHIRFARSVDWAATTLGPIENWSSDLRQMCNLIMASPHPAAMYWGEDLIAIYNEAYVLLAGQKHPRLMGQSYREAWAEIWDEVKDFFASARVTGEATMKDDDCLFIRRSNYLEETYFSWSIIPMVGRDGSVMGLYNPAFEKTRRKIAERRMLTLREVGERTASAREVKAFWAQVLESFKFNEYDSPLLLLYSVSDENESDSSSIHSNSALTSRQCFLEGKLGVPDGHPAAPQQIDLKTGTEGFGPVFKEVMKTDKYAVLEVGSPDLPESLLRDLDWRGFPDPVHSVVVCPIHPTTGENILGFLVLGVNPRRPYDDDYALFVQLLSRQLATSLASVVLFEEEIKRGQKAAKLAALDRIELSEKLAQRTQEAFDSEAKFARMAEFAPVGMVIAGPDGKIVFSNESWFEISRVPRDRSNPETWLDSVNPDDRVRVEQLWEDLIIEKKPISLEFRFKAQWEDRNGNRGDTWVLLSGYPEQEHDGRLKSVFATITNISQQKWAEGIQIRKMEEAVELKRQQENFIDITSHEMRNPLSAILQCSDEIASSLSSFRQSNERVISDELLTSCLDAAQIISLCSQHQKRIVDDILTLSKLDSQLLLVTPVDAQPLTVVQRALKMHESELQAADIHMKFVVDQSYLDLDLDWVRFDPSRVLQVLINLTTNAIKFTGREAKRTITVTISASRDRPSERADAPVRFFPTRRKGKDASADKEWGEGERLYILFSVRDTGRGLNKDDEKKLFQRFSQASPRTHVQYGGSGLGLFISRELTELQGGEIGVESEAGRGSVFAFYVLARRSTPPADTDGATGQKHSAGHHSRSKSLPFSAPQKSLETSANLLQPIANGTVHSSENVIKRVLIVEDNLVNQRVLQKQLKNIGTEVHLANHGGEALDKLRQSTYWADPSTPFHGAKLELGVILMDQEMPVMDGITCTRKIRELEKEGKLTGHVPIIAVTANARAEQVQMALDAGMDDVVAKPFRIPELLPKIEELMERYPEPSA